MYYSDINETPIDEAGVLKISVMALRCFREAPIPSIRAFCACTDIVYGIDLNDEGYIGAQIETNDLDIDYMGNAHIAAVMELYYKLIRLHGFNFFRQSAFALLLILCVLLAGYGRRGQVAEDYFKKVLICLPVFTYNFGTMLLLTGPDSRFFYSTYLICPMVILLLVHSRHRDTTA